MNNNYAMQTPYQHKDRCIEQQQCTLLALRCASFFWRNILAAAHAAPSTVPRSNHLFDSYANDTRFSQQATCRKASFQQ